LLARKRFDAVAQPGPGGAAQVDEDLQVVCLHAGHHAVEFGGRDRRRLMAVDVDDRKLRARHGMLRRDELRFGVVFADRRRPELRLAPFSGPRTNLARRPLGRERARDSAAASNANAGVLISLKARRLKRSQRAVSRILSAFTLSGSGVTTIS